MNNEKIKDKVDDDHCPQCQNEFHNLLQFFFIAKKILCRQENVGLFLFRRGLICSVLVVRGETLCEI